MKVDSTLRILQNLRRKSSNRRFRIIGGVIVLIVVVGAAAVFVLPRFFGLPENAAFKIRDTVVTQEQLSKRVDVLRALYGVQQPNDPEGKDKFNRDTAKAVAVSMVLDGAARDRGIVIPEKEARDSLGQFIHDQYPGNSREKFIQTLGSVGASENDVLTEIKRVMATSKLFQQATANSGNISDEEIRQHYDSHRDEMVTPEQRHLRNIVVANKQEAQEVLDQVQAGADFRNVAGQRSIDQSTKESQGDLGMVVPAQLEENYADAAFAAKPQSCFGPVQTRFGWNVGRVVEVVPPKPLTFDQARDQLRQELQDKHKSDRWREWFGSELEKANIEYGDKYRPVDAATVPPEPPNQAGTQRDVPPRSAPPPGPR